MKLVWVDLETSGLDSNVHEILEIAVAMSDLEDPFNVKHVYHAVLYAPVMMNLMDPFVVDMHTKNGLLAECRKSSTTWGQVVRALEGLIPEEDKHENRPVLAGASVHFDAGFLDRWTRRTSLPGERHLFSRFSHRYYDTSAIKLFCQSLGMPKIPRAEAHRAVADVAEAVAHAKACAEWLKGRQLDAVLHPQFSARLVEGETVEGTLSISPPTQEDVMASYKRWAAINASRGTLLVSPAKIVPAGGHDA